MFLSKLKLESLYSLACVNQLENDDEINLINDKTAMVFVYSKKNCFNLKWDEETNTWKI